MGKIYVVIDNYTYDAEVEDTLVDVCATKEIAMRKLQEHWEFYKNESYLSQFIDENGEVIEEELDECDCWEESEDSVEVYIIDKETHLSLTIVEKELIEE